MFSVCIGYRSISVRQNKNTQPWEGVAMATNKVGCHQITYKCIVRYGTMPTQECSEKDSRRALCWLDTVDKREYSIVL